MVGTWRVRVSFTFQESSGSLDLACSKGARTVVTGAVARLRQLRDLLEAFLVGFMVLTI